MIITAKIRQTNNLQVITIPKVLQLKTGQLIQLQITQLQSPMVSKNEESSTAFATKENTNN
jgi:hypothetical protein